MLVKEAKEVFGTKLGIARALDLPQSCLSRWGDTVPLIYQYPLQVLTKGKLMANIPESQSKAAKEAMDKARKKRK